jgi:CRISPR/Cas system-associated endonuclease Cas3-HD
MTRKDYILIAEALRIQYLNPSEPIPGTADDNFRMAVLTVAKEIADSLSRQNGRFNYDHFISVVRGEKDLLSRPKRAA